MAYEVQHAFAPFSFWVSGKEEIEQAKRFGYIALKLALAEILIFSEFLQLLWDRTIAAFAGRNDLGDRLEKLPLVSDCACAESLAASWPWRRWSRRRFRLWRREETLQRSRIISNP